MPNLSSKVKFISSIPDIYESNCYNLSLQQQQEPEFNNITKILMTNNTHNHHHCPNISLLNQPYQPNSANHFNFNCNQQTDNHKGWSDRVLRHISGLLYVLSSTGCILYCSESCTSLTGYQANELNGRSLIDFLHIDDVELFKRNFQYSFQFVSKVKLYFRIRCKDNSYLLLETIGQPKSDTPGRSPQFFFAIAQPYMSKSNELYESFLEIKSENERLKKKLNDLLCVNTNTEQNISSFPSQYNIPNTTNIETNSQQQNSSMMNQPYFYESHVSYSSTSSPPLFVSDKSTLFSSYLPRKSSDCSTSTLIQNHMNNSVIDDATCSKNTPWAINQHTSSIPSSSEHDDIKAPQEYHDIKLFQEFSNSNSSNTDDKSRNLLTMRPFPTSNNITLSSILPETIQKEKWKRRKKNKGLTEYVCTDCGTTSSPEWRKGPHGSKTLCNACGLRWAKKNKQI